MPTGIGTLITTYILSTTTTLLSAGVARALYYVGVNLLIGFVLRGKEQSQEIGNNVSTGVSVFPHWQIIYGAPRIGGDVTFMHSSGTQREFLHLVITLSGHELNAINTVYFDNSPVLIDGSGDSVDGNKFFGHAHIEKRLGTVNQTAYQTLIDASVPSWLIIEGVSEGVRFDGQGTVMSAGPSALLAPSTTMTVEFVVFSHADQEAVILEAAGGTSARWRWQVKWMADRRIRFTDNAGNTVETVPLYLQRWWYLAIRVSGSTLRIHLKRVGSSDTANYSTAAAYDNSGTSDELFFGSADGKSEFFQGDLDNVRIWADERTDSEVISAGLSGTDSPTPTDNLNANWKLSETSGTTAADSSGNGLTATLESLWTTDHRQQGRASIYVRLRRNQSLFPRGIPNISVDVEGKKTLDPRLSVVATVDDASGVNLIVAASHGLSDGQELRFASFDGVLDSALSSITRYWIINATGGNFQVSEEPGGSAVDLQADGTGTMEYFPVDYSPNVALAVSDYVMQRDFGTKVPITKLDMTALSAAANICDEPVSLVQSGTSEPRYEAHGVLKTDRIHQTNLQTLIQSMSGRLALAGSLYGIYAGAYISPILTLTEDDFLSDPTITTQSKSDSFNVIKGAHPNPFNFWQPEDYPTIKNATYIANEGEELLIDYSLPMTTSRSMCQRLAKIELERNNQGIEVQLKTKIRIMEAVAPETIAITHTELGWAGKPFEILSMRPLLEPIGQGSDPVLHAFVHLRETAAGVYTWSAEETTIDLAPNSNLPNPQLVIGPASITIESGTNALYKKFDGTIWSRIHLTWELPEDIFVLEDGFIDIQYRKTLLVSGTEDSWLTFGSINPSAMEAYIPDVEDGVAYDVQLRARNNIGAVSPWIQELNHVVVGKTEPPENVLNFTAQQNGQSVTFIWDDVGDIDLAGYAIRYTIVGVPWEDAKLLQNVLRGRRITDAAVPPSPLVDSIGTRAPWQFWIKAVDTSENESLAATGYQLIVTPTYDAKFQFQQWPAWPGTLMNLVRNPLTGFLNPRSGSGPDASDLFTTFVSGMPSLVAYETEEIDIGFEDRSRVWIDDRATLGVGETGLVDLEELLDYRLDAESFDGFEVWGVGELVAQHYIGRIEDSPTVDGGVSIQRMAVVIDIIEHEETGSIAIASAEDDGLEVSFQQVFRQTPDPANLEITPPSGLMFSYHGLSVTGFKVWWLDGSGIPQTGTGSYSVSGV